ncbi:MAG TPA: hypothetical protein VF600_05755 [Abditibacteriaceae bacterium]|jgi:hypothetical protein
MKSRTSRWLGLCCALFLIGTLAMSIPTVRTYVYFSIFKPTVGARGDRNWWDAKTVAGEFLMRSRARDHSGAHQLLSTRMRGRTTVTNLQAQWRLFESAHGGIRNWRSTKSNNSIAFPTYVDFNIAVTGFKSGAGNVSMHLIPENGTWRIDTMSIQP